MYGSCSSLTPINDLKQISPSALSISVAAITRLQDVVIQMTEISERVYCKSPLRPPADVATRSSVRLRLFVILRLFYPLQKVW